MTMPSVSAVRAKQKDAGAKIQNANSFGESWKSPNNLKI